MAQSSDYNFKDIKDENTLLSSEAKLLKAEMLVSLPRWEVGKEINNSVINRKLWGETVWGKLEQN